MNVTNPALNNRKNLYYMNNSHHAKLTINQKRAPKSKYCKRSRAITNPRTEKPETSDSQHSEKKKHQTLTNSLFTSFFVPQNINGRQAQVFPAHLATVRLRIRFHRYRFLFTFVAFLPLDFNVRGATALVLHNLEHRATQLGLLATRTLEGRRRYFLFYNARPLLLQQTVVDDVLGNVHPAQSSVLRHRIVRVERIATSVVQLLRVVEIDVAGVYFFQVRG